MFNRASSFLLGLYWRFRHLVSPGWGESYLDKIGHPVTEFIVDRILAVSPFSTVMEFGASSGPNLIALSRRQTGLSCLGLDISSAAVAAGTSYIREKGVRGVELRIGSERDMAALPEASFDVVFAAAVLIYFDESAVEKVIASMLRSARKGVVIVEQAAPPDGRSVFDGRKWLHDYGTILSRLGEGWAVQSDRIPAEVWPGDWSERGRVYTLLKKKA